MGTPIQAVPPAAQPWARGVEANLKDINRKLGIVSSSIGSLPSLDKTVTSEYSGGKNMAAGTSGKAAPPVPVAVRFVSSTGLFEVTVSLAGMVRDGAVFGAGFESGDIASEIEFDLPKNGVAFAAPLGQTQWLPFSQSYSTILSVRPGVQDLSLYLYAVTTAVPNSAAYLKRARLTVKAV